MEHQINAVYSPPTMLDLQNHIRELNDLVADYQGRLKRMEADLRDRFAMAALAGLLAGKETDDSKKAAEWAYSYADAMMEHRMVEGG